jgi:hypothetical protein
VLDVGTIVGTRLAEALDALRCAALLTNEHGTILHANRSAEHMLEEGGSIQSALAIRSQRVSIRFARTKASSK